MLPLAVSKLSNTKPSVVRNDRIVSHVFCAPPTDLHRLVVSILHLDIAQVFRAMLIVLKAPSTPHNATSHAVSPDVGASPPWRTGTLVGRKHNNGVSSAAVFICGCDLKSNRGCFLQFRFRVQIRYDNRI